MPVSEETPLICTVTPSNGVPLLSVTVMANPPSAPAGAGRGAVVRGGAGFAVVVGFAGVVGCGCGAVAGFDVVACPSSKLSSNAITIRELYGAVGAKAERIIAMAARGIRKRIETDPWNLHRLARSAWAGPPERGDGGTG